MFTKTPINEACSSTGNHCFSIGKDVEVEQKADKEILIKYELQEAQDNDFHVSSMEHVDAEDVKLNNEQDINLFLGLSKLDSVTVKDEFVDENIGQCNGTISQCDFTLENNCEKFKCEHCNYETMLKRILIKHMKRHGLTLKHNLKTCKQCDFKSKYKSHLKRHVSVQHSLTEFECMQCDYTSKSKKNLKSHISRHNSTVFKCKNCDYTSKYKYNLKIHINVHHGSTEFKCTQCDYTSKYQERLRRHASILHSSNEFKCNQCNYTSKYQPYLKRHINVRHG